MQSGFGIIHSNHLETLADALIEWCDRDPLLPLEEETILVQSNGMADWLKLRQAEAKGISASSRYIMPSSFLWQMYRQVLTPEQMDDISPYGKDSLQWRIWRLLPDLLKDAAFTRPARFLADDNSQTKRFQLSRKLADLFDQYQLYRSHWLTQWERGKSLGLGQDEAWQQCLWQTVVRDINATQGSQSRAQLHQTFLSQLQHGHIDAQLPERIFLFGINSLPAQLLNALYALSAHTQIILLILNPCQDFWDDIPADDTPMSQPLLDSWGGRGRDFMRLLHDQEERQPDAFRENVDEIRVFVSKRDEQPEHFTRNTSLLHQIQESILNNTPPAAPQLLPASPGLAFYPAYSRQREVEVLHDKLLDLFAQDTSLGYRDIVVMVPNIEQYSAHIEAVFNRQDWGDKRHLNFSISDRHQLADTSLFQAVNFLLELPTSRFAQSDIFSLLEQPALRQRFQLQEDDLPLLRRWTNQSYIRWGFNGSHRKALLSLDNADNQHNSWQYGLDQLLAGYCAGSLPNAATTDNSWPTIALDEVSANQGDVLGHFHQLVTQLENWRQRLGKARTPSEWQHLFDYLLTQFFEANDDRDKKTLYALRDALNSWAEDCRLANFTETLPLTQARTGWLDKVQQAGLSQQLAFRGITFCTLMPMRALPFKHVFLLGMNDGDYPREQLSPDFDLMQQHYEPGDRDRRGDDQYLFLEALLSVRDSLHISWIGKDINDGSERTASTLVEQLRDHINTCWHTDNGQTASQLLTHQQPLAPFSRHYFEKADFETDGDNPRTHNTEWLALHQPASAQADNPLLPGQIDSLSQYQLAALIRQPVAVFLQDRMQVRFLQASLEDDDDEPFQFNALEEWQLRNTLLHVDNAHRENACQLVEARGELPPGRFGDPFLHKAADSADNILQRMQEVIGTAEPMPPRTFSLPLTANGLTAELNGTLSNCWQDAEIKQVHTSASNLKNKGSWRVDKLANLWVSHLVACALGDDTSSHLVGRDSRVQFAAIPPEDAQHQLNTLFGYYLEARQYPLPVAPNAAASWLKNASYGKAKVAFEGGYNVSGDLGHPAVNRAFDSFSDIWPANSEGDAFTQWVENIYRPLLNAIGDNRPNSKEANA